MRAITSGLSHCALTLLVGVAATFGSLAAQSATAPSVQLIEQLENEFGLTDRQVRGALGALLDMVEKRKLPLCTLAEALQDPAYKSEDQFFGAGGISWIHRWAVTRKMPKSTYEGEPSPPQYVKELQRQSQGS